MTGWPLRVTIIVPNEMRDDANNLAMVLGAGPADVKTFNLPTWQDWVGNSYSVASTQARSTFPVAAGASLQRPIWDIEPYQVNMAGAGRAQAALVVCTAGDLTPLQVGKITAIIGGDPLVVAAAMGLTRTDQD